jgi:hypothetical protein
MPVKKSIWDLHYVIKTCHGSDVVGTVRRDRQSVDSMPVSDSVPERLTLAPAD